MPDPVNQEIAHRDMYISISKFFNSLTKLVEVFTKKVEEDAKKPGRS